MSSERPSVYAILSPLHPKMGEVPRTDRQAKLQKVHESIGNAQGVIDDLCGDEELLYRLFTVPRPQQGLFSEVRGIIKPHLSSVIEMTMMEPDVPAHEWGCYAFALDRLIPEAVRGKYRRELQVIYEHGTQRRGLGARAALEMLSQKVADGAYLSGAGGLENPYLERLRFFDPLFSDPKSRPPPDDIRLAQLIHESRTNRT